MWTFGGSTGIVPRMTTLNERVRNLLSQSEKKGCDTVQILRLEGKVEGLVCTRALEDGAGNDLHFVERVCMAITDEVEELPQSRSATFMLRTLKDAKTVLEERAKVPGRAVVPQASSIVAAAPSAPAPLRRMEGAITGASDVITPELESAHGQGAYAILAASLRQQMRHNEALMGQLVTLSGKIHEPSAKMIEQLGSALSAANKEVIEQAKQTVEMIKNTRVMEAEARTAETKAKSIDRISEQLTKFIPVAVTRVMNRYGLKETPDGAAPAGSSKGKKNGAAASASPPTYEQKIAAVAADLLKSIVETPDQMVKLTEVFTLTQQAMIAELFTLWDTEQQRVDKLEKAAAEEKKTADEPKASNGAS